MDWFRSWHGAPTDTKFLVIARRANVAPGMVSAVYWALLDHASQNNPRGSVDGFDAEAYAAWAGWEESDVLAIIAAFVVRETIKDGQITAWEKRQPKREDDSGPRVKRYRDNQRAASVTDESVTHGNASVTHGNAPDKIREDSEEIRQEERREDSPPAAQPPHKPRTVAPGSQQDMFGAIADACQLDATLKRGQIAKQSKALLEAGYTPAQVRAFPAWWQSHDWRGQRGNVPTLAQLAELIKQSTTQTNGTDPAKKREVNRLDRILGVDIHGNAV